jgi:hypothetical protein
MKAITVKGPIAWAIFNANYTTLLRYEPVVDCPAKLAIHVGKSTSKLDVERFFMNTGIATPAANRLFLGQVIGIVTVETSADRYSHWDWKISSPIPVKQFDYKGQPGIYEIPDDCIDYDCSKNPIIEECGYKTKGNPKGYWRVNVWPHPHIKNHYSYAVAIAGGVMSGGIPEHDLLHGCYGDPEEALQAGIKELYE